MRAACVRACVRGWVGGWVGVCKYSMCEYVFSSMPCVFSACCFYNAPHVLHWGVLPGVAYVGVELELIVLRRPLCSTSAFSLIRFYFFLLFLFPSLLFFSSNLCRVESLFFFLICQYFFPVSIFVTCCQSSISCFSVSSSSLHILHFLSLSFGLAP